MTDRNQATPDPTRGPPSQADSALIAHVEEALELGIGSQCSGIKVTSHVASGCLLVHVQSLDRTGWLIRLPATVPCCTRVLR